MWYPLLHLSHRSMLSASSALLQVSQAVSSVRSHTSDLAAEPAANSHKLKADAVVQTARHLAAFKASMMMR